MRTRTRRWRAEIGDDRRRVKLRIELTLGEEKVEEKGWECGWRILQGWSGGM